MSIPNFINLTVNYIGQRSAFKKSFLFIYFLIYLSSFGLFSLNCECNGSRIGFKLTLYCPELQHGKGRDKIINKIW